MNYTSIKLEKRDDHVLEQVSTGIFWVRNGEEGNT